MSPEGDAAIIEPPDGQPMSAEDKAKYESVLRGDLEPSVLTQPTPTEEANQPAASAEQGAETPATTPPADAQKADEAPDKAEMSTEEIVNSMLGAESPEKETQRLKRQLAASSKGGIRVSQQLKQVQQLLKDQNRELVFEGDKVTGLAVTKDGGGSMKKVKVNVDDLEEDIQVAFQTDPQQAANHILEQAHRHYASQTTPTAERPTDPPTPEHLAEVIDFLSEEVKPNGEKMRPGFKEKNIPVIQQMLDNPRSEAKAFRDFYNADSQAALNIADGYIRHLRQANEAEGETAKKSSTDKKNSAADTPPVGPAGAGVASQAGDNSLSREIGMAIANASPGSRY